MIIKLIQLIHLILIIIIITSVFIPNYQLKQFSFAFLIFIFIHWITNYGRCGLTEIEYIIRGEKYKEGFIYRIVKPIITIPEKYFENYIHLIHAIWTFVLYYQITQIH